MTKEWIFNSTKIRKRSFKNKKERVAHEVQKMEENNKVKKNHKIYIRLLRGIGKCFNSMKINWIKRVVT